MTTQNLHSQKLNDRKSIVQNFKTMQVELHSCKVEKLNVSIETPLSNPVTYVCTYVCTILCVISTYVRT